MKPNLCNAIAIAAAITSGYLCTEARESYNFNSDWLLTVGDKAGADAVKFDDSEWKKVTLPRAFNEDEAFKVSIYELTDTIAWYRKHFKVPAADKGKKIFLEFEGVRQGADFYLNGHHLGLHENGVMAVGFDITPYVKFGKENVLAVRTDNNWRYRERATNSLTSGTTATSMPTTAVFLKMYVSMLPTRYTRPCRFIATSAQPAHMSMPTTSKSTVARHA